MLWETGKEKAVYPFDLDHGVDNPHQGTVTALHFTPDGKLVSAARDNTLRVWQLHEKGAELAGEPVTGRSGTVAIPGVTATADDQFMVYDRGRTLQLLSVKDQRTMAVLNNSSATRTSTSSSSRSSRARHAARVSAGSHLPPGNSQ